MEKCSDADGAAGGRERMKTIKKMNRDQQANGFPEKSRSPKSNRFPGPNRSPRTNRSLKDGEKRRIQKNSIYRLTIRNSALMIVIIVLMGILFFAFYHWATTELFPMSDTSYDSLKKQEKKLKNEDYKNIQLGKNLGKSGYFEIVDDEANVLYCSKNVTNTYPSDFLDYLPDFSYGVNYSVLTIKTGSGNQYILLREDANVDSSLSGVTILDADRNILYSDMNYGDGKISSKTLEVLQENEKGEQLVIEKYPFTTANGDLRYLLLHSAANRKEMQKMKFRLAAAETILFFVLTILVIFFVGMRTAHRMKKPLEKLETAMDGLASGQRSRLEDTQDLQEVSEVMQTFNEMEQKLQKSEEKQKELQVQQQKMLADISHDIKTPLTVIQGYIDAMNDGLVTEKERATCLQIIGNKLQLLSELTDTFGEFSRLEHPNFNLNLERRDLCEYLREYLAEKYEELSMSGYPLSVDIPEQKIACDIDTMQLKRVFENIIGNAVRHTDPGTELFVNMRAENGQAVIELGDDGPGIPADMAEQIFDPFVVGEKARTSGRGTGLGLSIAKKIIELHGGTIELEQREKGTWYKIQLPAAA